MRENTLRGYVERARIARSHVAKQVVLAELLREVFEVELEEILPRIEEKVGSEVLGVKGKIDLLARGVVFEVKVDLKRELREAEEGLKKYFQALYERDPEGRYVGIATDVINFKAYIPVIEGSRVVGVKEISSLDISSAPYSEAILWLDSFIFSKPKIRPTAEDLKWRFGPKSPTYALAVDELKKLWNEVRDDESVKLKLGLWAKSMEIVYGSKPETSAFIDHTYLVVLVKLIVYLRLSGEDVITEEKVRRALTGEYFTSHGISNLIEEDFFSWILHEKVADKALRLTSIIAKEMLRYDLSQIDEDFFKEIYQEIVERGQRHRIGEYYTPEWLTELILREVLSLWWEKSEKPPRVLDPACGSGTFLCNTIHMLRDELSRRGWKHSEILDFILNNISGVDVNPLAVLIARANYLIALGNLLHLGKTINIPVYVADSIKIPKVNRSFYGGIEVYAYPLNGASLDVPASVVKDCDKFRIVINAFKDALNSYREKRDRDVAYAVFKRGLSGKLDDYELNVLVLTLNNILKLMDKGLDSIWVFMLSNIYAPITLKEQKFDIVVGNPPWIAMRYVENKEYQDFLKGQVFTYGLLDKSQVHLFTQMEVATLFFCRSSDLYLKEGGIIAFVQPRSVLTGALHHANFRRFRKPKMKLVRIYDLEGVSPLFNVPTCVLLAIKGETTIYPVLARKYKGKLPEKNLKLSDASKHFSVSDYEYKAPEIPTCYSPYYRYIKAGAAIYPRCFYFIDFDIHPVLGIDAEKPLVKTSEEVMKNAKEPWKNIRLSGNVDSEYIYATLLGGDIVPFGYIKMRSVVLPIEPIGNRYRLLDVKELRKEGRIHTANWFEKVQEIWEEKGTDKAKKNFPRFIDGVDYQGLLSSQDPNAKYVTVYNSSGTNLVSCVINKNALPMFHILRTSIKPVNFVADKKTHYYETNNEMEAHYLCAILNSNVVNDLIKPLQTRGLFGERDIGRRPFMFPVPRFDGNNLIHLRLAELSKTCHRKVASLRFTKKSTAGRREEARNAVKRELEEIDELVSKLLGM